MCSYNDTSASISSLFTISFDSGSGQYSNNTPARFGFSTTYSQKFQPNINDGQFGIVNSVPNSFALWQAGALDHTPGDTGGYMLLVNADYTPGRVFNATIDFLCNGSSYEISVYLANIMKPSSSMQPNITFEVRTATSDNAVLARLSTGAVPMYPNVTWTKYGMSFVTNVSSVMILMTSNAPGGGGNDFVIDDIELRTCAKPGLQICPLGMFIDEFINSWEE